MHGNSISHNQFIERFNMKNKHASSIKIVSEYTKSGEPITAECKKCGNIWTPLAYNLIQGQGCPCCSGHTVVKGINDLWTTDCELASLLYDSNFGYTHSHSSTIKTDWKCAACGEFLCHKSPSDMKNKIRLCALCSDGVSFPNKVMYSVLRQLGVDFIFEKTFVWSEKKRYDFYIQSQNMIIEVHGEQHYKKSKFNYVSNKTLQDEQLNDLFKKQIALSNGIRHYVVINAMNSNVDYIKESVLDSAICELFDVSQINWEQCLIFATRSLIYEVAQNYSDFNDYDINRLVIKYNLSRPTIRKYLKIGNRLGICKYDAKESIIATNLRNHVNNKSPCICINTQEIFDSQNQAGVTYGIAPSSIGACCLGKRLSAGRHPSTHEKLKWGFYEREAS